MPIFYHSPNSRSTSILTLVHELGDPEDLEIIRVTIPGRTARAGATPGTPIPRARCR